MPLTPDHPYANQEDFYETCDGCDIKVALPHYTSNRQKLCTDCFADYCDQTYEWVKGRKEDI